MSRRLALLLALALAACKPAPPKPAARVAVPPIRATVVTLRTTIQPGNQTIAHTIVILGTRARSTAEHDTWRVFDTKAKTITFVDDIERTVRTESLDAVSKRHREALAGDLPAHFPSARLVRGEATKTLLGVTARQSAIEAGAYRRELWIAEHPAIPPGLFAMMQAAETPSSPLAPMMREVDEALDSVEGFPLVDHAEVPYGEKKFVVDRVVVNIVQQNVPQSVIAIPVGYRDVTPKPQ